MAEGGYVFKHKSQEVSRSKLVVLQQVVRHLDGIIKGRKVGFLSAVGKPREGKSTSLTLIGWHFMKARGLHQTDIFQVSNSTQVQKTVTNPNHHYLSKRSTAIHLPVVLQSVPRKP